VHGGAERNFIYRAYKTSTIYSILLINNPSQHMQRTLPSQSFLVTLRRHLSRRKRVEEGKEKGSIHIIHMTSLIHSLPELELKSTHATIDQSESLRAANRIAIGENRHLASFVSRERASERVE
jgi:hypothetical protein